MEPNDIHPGLSSLLTEPCFIRNPVQAVLHFQEIFLSNWLLINCCGAVLTNMQLHQQSFSAEGTLHHALQGRKENGENSWKEEADKENYRLKIHSRVTLIHSALLLLLLYLLLL